MDAQVNPDTLKFNDGSSIGLGLIISKQIVQNMGGKLEFCSEFKIGSTFVFSFNLTVCDGINDDQHEPEQGRQSP